MIKSFKIGSRLVGQGEPCFIVAEISANHRQQYEEAVALVEAAREAGADAVKFQTYTPDTLTIDSDKKWFFLGGEDTPSDWKRSNLYELYKGAYTPWDCQPKLKELAEKLGLIFFSSPFDETAVDFLEKMEVPCYKVASYEATHLPLLKKIAETGKPVIMSVGFASLEEIEEAVRTLRENGAKEIAVLHCVTAYSDNPRPEEFKKMAGLIRRGENIYSKGEFEAAQGEVFYGPVSPAEENFRNLRRSIFAVADIKKGEVFTKENIRVIRPAFGLPPKFYDEVLGKRAVSDIERGTPFSRGMIAF